MREESSTLLCCVPTFNEPMLSRELDEYVARELLQWQLTKVGPDVYGADACEILTPNGNLQGDLPRTVFDLPRTGKINPSYLVPEYSRGLQHAIGLANQLGFKQVTIRTNELSFRIPELIVRCVIGSVLAAKQADQTTTPPQE